MTSTGPATPADYDVRLDIRSSPQPDDKWEQQLNLIRSAGAAFEGGSWYLWLDGSQLTTERTEPLWRAVAEYGTQVKIGVIRPRSEP